MDPFTFFTSKKPSHAILVTTFLIFSTNSMAGLSESLPEPKLSSGVDTNSSSVTSRGNRTNSVKPTTSVLTLKKTTKAATKKVRMGPDTELVAIDLESRLEPGRLVSTRKFRSR